MYLRSLSSITPLLLGGCVRTSTRSSKVTYRVWEDQGETPPKPTPTELSTPELASLPLKDLKTSAICMTVRVSSRFRSRPSSRWNRHAARWRFLPVDFTGGNHVLVPQIRWSDDQPVSLHPTLDHDSTDPEPTVVARTSRSPNPWRCLFLDGVW